MKGLIENRFGLLALVLVALAALYGAAYVGRPAPVVQRQPQAVKAPVEAVSVVCPAPGGTRISVVTPPHSEGPDAEGSDDKGPGGKGTGSATLTRVHASAEAAGAKTGKGGGSPKPEAVIDRPGVLWQREMPAGGGPITVAASGSMAPGLESAQTARDTSGTQRGLAGVRCVEPGADAWFVGPGPAGADVRLYLANADAAPADVSVMIYSGEGPVLSDRGNGVILQPGEHKAIELRDLAPSPLVMALRVSTGNGRVAAAVKVVLRKGVDWLPVAAAPSTTVVVPGIPGIAGRRELYVTAPGEEDTVVQVKAVLKDGFYALKNKEDVDVPAGSTATMDLTTGIGGQPAALVLTSDVPIVAGMVITGTGAVQDVAFTAGAQPIDLGSVVADGRSSRKQTSRLVLSAPFAAGAVQIRILPQKGTVPKPMEVTVPAGRTREVKLKPPAGSGSAFAVVVQPQPGSGPVYGGRVLDESTRDGLLITAQPLALARIWTLVPPTTDSPAAVLP
ncbi:DUF5719 family protein [Sphaerimonospora thailandensis]|uniref:Secreted protein n=1 Tax=Sphaerimonospora thailandensis TaxID=795644 RepID=A0A8J3RAA6_9ACTN|nr:DUF5719 family protein [Sphaerimonospora thailandensis]GIH72296.1 hypothetical protein Mth01_45490 [Sphaerimonospora thailandensis]